jgi:hypothetical protein
MDLFKNLVLDYQVKGFKIDHRRTLKHGLRVYLKREAKGILSSGFDGVYLYYVDGYASDDIIRECLRDYAKFYEDEDFGEGDKGFLVCSSIDEQLFRKLRKVEYEDNDIRKSIKPLVLERKDGEKEEEKPKRTIKGRDKTPASETFGVMCLIENNLRKAIRQKPAKESELNDALETLFIGAGLEKNFTREKEHIPYSSKTYVPDFVFKRIGTAVETKLCDRAGRDKEIIAEINDDIVAYKTAYRNLIFVVYDSSGIIRNVDEFRGSIEEQESVIVKVIKH